MTVPNSILQILKDYGPMSDADLAERLHIRHQQINQACRKLADQRRLLREASGSLIVNRLPGQALPQSGSPTTSGTDGLLTEDEIKRAVSEYLERQGYQVKVMWGRARGIDIDARSETGRIIIEAKGQVDPASRNFHQMQGNYFLNALGELIQRIDDPVAVYALALPDEPRSRGLVERLPQLARERLRLRVFFVSRRNDEFVIREA